MVGERECRGRWQTAWLWRRDEDGDIKSMAVHGMGVGLNSLAVGVHMVRKGKIG